MMTWSWGIYALLLPAAFVVFVFSAVQFRRQGAYAYDTVWPALTMFSLGVWVTSAVLLAVDWLYTPG